MSSFLNASKACRVLAVLSLWGLFMTTTYMVTAHKHKTPTIEVKKSTHIEEETDIGVLPFCPPDDEAGGSVATNSNVLIVSTLDGKITALDPSQGPSASLDDSVLWTVKTQPGDMLSSTISQMELTDNAKWVKLIPSLAGGLYKFDGETVEAVPLTAETLLKTSFKFADNTIITGGKESRTYGIELDTGRIRYECSMDGCQNFYGDDNMDDVLVIQRETQTVRAVEPRTGQEKWNFSVSQHHVEFNAGMSDLCKNRRKQPLTDPILFKAVVSDGIICSVDKSEPDKIVWKHQFGAPIVHAWQVLQGSLIAVDLFSTSHIPSVDEPDRQQEKKPLLYIGSHNKQVYIQESSDLKDKRLKHPMLNSEILQNMGIDERFPRISWRPYLISADSRTQIYNHGSRVDNSKLPLLSYDTRAAENTALAVFTGSDYPFDSGLYLFPDEPDLDYDPVLSFGNKVSLDEDEKDIDNDDQEENAGNELPPTHSIQIVITSLEYWWKEVLFISFVTAILMNWFISKPIINMMKEDFKRKLDLAYRHIQFTGREVVVVEVPVPMEKSSGPGSNNNNTPNTASTNSIQEFSWSKSQEGEFSSRFLADFEPVQCLGKGGFGVVFESKNKIDDIHYAVKRIKLPEIEEEKKKVMREVKFLAKLDHKNIVRYFNTWLEKPPPGWQEERDNWWKMHLDSMSTRTGMSPGSFSQTDYPTEDYDDSSMNNNSSLLRQTNSFSLTNDPPPLPSYEHTNDSFCIAFEDSAQHTLDENTEDEESASSKKVIAKEQTSLTSECDDALEWEEKNKKNKNSSREHVYLYIVMQLCQKESLRDWLRSCKIERSRQKSLHLFHQICLGVSYVHSQGLIHRDLKPSNIFFSADGTVKIGDFGLVKGQKVFVDVEEKGNEEQDTEEDEEDGLVLMKDIFDAQHTDQVGTELYMSPEQLRRKPYDHKVDIYSLGLILFELLVPFSTQMERITTLSDLRKLKFPDHFVSQEEFPLVKSMLSHDPKMRPETTEVLEMDFLMLEEETINEGVVGREGDAPGRRTRKNTSCSSAE